MGLKEMALEAALKKVLGGFSDAIKDPSSKERAKLDSILNRYTGSGLNGSGAEYSADSARKERLSRYAPDTKADAIDNVLTTVGTVAEGIGGYRTARGSLLGAALTAVANGGLGMNTGRLKNPLTAMMPAAAAGATLQGLFEGAVAGTTGKAVNKLAENRQRQRVQKRMAEMIAAQEPGMSVDAVRKGTGIR